MKNCPECDKNDWEIKEYLIESMEPTTKGAIASLIFGNQPMYITSKINTKIHTCKRCGYMKFFKKE